MKKVLMVLLSLLCVLITFLSLSFPIFMLLPDPDKYSFVITCLNHNVYPSKAIDYIVENDLLIDSSLGENRPYFKYRLSPVKMETPADHYRSDTLFILALYLMDHTQTNRTSLDSEQFKNAYAQMLKTDDTLFYFRTPFCFATHWKGFIIDPQKAMLLANLFEVYRATYPESIVNDAKKVNADYNLFMQISMNLMTQEDLYNIANQEELASNVSKIRILILDEYEEAHAIA